MRQVFIPVNLPRGQAGPVLVTDADGHPHAVTSGNLTIGGPLCVRARPIRREGDRLFVRFADNSSCWIRSRKTGSSRRSRRPASPIGA
jgi:hypothetical protein